MSELPETLTAAGIVFRRAEAPAGLASWSAEGPPDGPSVNLVIAPAAEPHPAVLDIAGGVHADFDRLVGVAEDYLRDALRLPAWHLSADELALLAAPEPPFALPTAVVWSDGTWMVHFAECGLALGEEYGIGVSFRGEEPVGVEDLGGAEPVDG